MDGPKGFCKRYAPTHEEKYAFAITDSDQFCGDWEEGVVPRIVHDKSGGGYVWYFILGKQRSQDFASKFEMLDAQELGHVEWRDLE